MKLFAFHFMLILLGKASIHLFFPHLWVTSRADWVFSFGRTTDLGEGNFKPAWLCWKIDCVSHPAPSGGVRSIHIHSDPWWKFWGISLSYPNKIYDQRNTTHDWLYWKILHSYIFFIIYTCWHIHKHHLVIQALIYTI